MRKQGRQSNMRPGADAPAQALPASSATPQKMSRSETSTPSSANARSTSRRIDRAGHDRRRAGRMQARDLAALGQRQRRQAVEQLLQPLARDRVALDPVAVVALELEVDRGELRRRAAHADRAAGAARARRRGRPPRSRARVLGQRRELAGRSADRVCRWRSVWRTTPTCVETWKTRSAPAPTTSSVEPPPMSITSTSSSPRPARGRAERSQPRLLVADSVAASSP